MLYVRALIAVIRQPLYLLITTLVAGIVFTFAVWLPSLSLIVIVAKNASLTELLSLMWSLYGAIGSNFTAISASYTTIIAILFGLNVALLTYYIRKMRGGISNANIGSTGAASAGGLVSGIFGIGCAACGTFIFTSVLTLFGIAGVLSYLPFGGEEFGFLGVALLGYSLYTLGKKITDPFVCPI